MLASFCVGIFSVIRYLVWNNLQLAGQLKLLWDADNCLPVWDVF